MSIKLIFIMLRVVKMNGKVDVFKKDKIINTAIRAGASRELAKRVADEIAKKVYDGIPTREILKMVKEELKKEDEHLAKVYTLKDAIASLNPDIHEFEHYVASLFSVLGYDTVRSPDPKPQGKCVDHEIDVVAKKGEETIIIECKHHYKERTFTGLDVIMRQHARMIDINEGYEVGLKHSLKVTRAGVVTNTQFSDYAIKYGKCRNILMISWRYPDGMSIADIVNRTKAFPLTLLSLPLKTREMLINEHVRNVLEFLEADASKLRRVGIKEKRIKFLKEKAERLTKIGVK